METDRYKQIQVNFNYKTGGIERIVCPEDVYKMNWCSDSIDFGTVMSADIKNVKIFDMRAEADYSTKKLDIAVKRTLKNNVLTENYTFKNNGENDVFIQKGELGIAVPLADGYVDADTCITNRCNVHLWCGKNTSYICAVKMGESDICMGLVLKSGSIDEYSTGKFLEQHLSDEREGFVLHPAPFVLRQGESITIEWDIFFCSGMDEFYDIAAEYRSIAIVEADTYTVFENEPIKFGINRKDARVFLDGKEKECVNGIVEHIPNYIGEHKFVIKYGDNYETEARFFVSESIETLAKKRIDFIVNKQQFHSKDSRLDGAYLIYDNENECVYCDTQCNDHNASRERVGMGLLIANWLRRNNDERIMKSLLQYMDFIYREIYDEETGCVYNNVGRQTTQLRLYNAPWIAELMTEMYWITGNKKYLEDMVKIECWYYQNGGDKFYPNAVFINDFAVALKAADMLAEYDKLLKLFEHHAENIINIGTSYPKHEVNFEQTIVAPAVTHLQNMYMITGDEKYLEASKIHMAVLERFNGRQPDYHLYEIAIRHWDGYWFGKNKLHGDTFPHYWSSLSSLVFLERYKLTGEEEYKKKGIAGMHGCLCLFDGEGRGYCAYMYPYTSCGRPGKYFDPYANDQDFALYYNYKYLTYKEGGGENEVNPKV